MVADRSSVWVHIKRLIEEQKLKEPVEFANEITPLHDIQSFESLSNSSTKKQVATDSSKQNNNSSPEMMKIQVTYPSKAVASHDATELADTDISNVTSSIKTLPQPTRA